jgi:hypothetical protein
MDKIEQLLIDAYSALQDEDFDIAFGCVAEALARVQGDTGSFDNQEGV